MEKSDRLVPFLKKGFLFSFLGLLLFLLLSIFSNNDIRGVESNVVYTIQQILIDNTALYQDPNNLSYAITQYSPLYYIINDAILSLLGIDSSNVLAIRITSRLVSITFLVSTCLIFFKILNKHLNLTKENALLFTLLLIIFTFPWYSISRPDILILFFIITSIYLFIKHLSSNTPKYILGIGAIAFLSIMSKQNGLVPAFIFGLFLLLNLDWKSICLMFAGCLISGLLFYGIVVLAGYDLTYIKANIIDGLKNSINIDYAIKKPYKDFIVYFGLFSIGTVVFTKAYFKSWLKPQRSLPFLLVLAIVFLILFSVISALKVGSGVNYFNELVILMLLLLAYVLSLKPQNLNTQKLLVFLCVIGIQVNVIHYSNYSMRILRGINETYVSSNTIRQDVIDFLDENLYESYFFSEDRLIGLSIHEKCVLPQVEIHEASLNKGVFDYTNLKEDFHNGTIKYLILYSEIKPILDIDIENLYAFDRQIGNLNVYKFKN